MCKERKDYEKVLVLDVIRDGESYFNKKIVQILLAKAQLPSR